MDVEQLVGISGAIISISVYGFILYTCFKRHGAWTFNVGAIVASVIAFEAYSSVDQWDSFIEPSPLAAILNAKKDGKEAIFSTANIPGENAAMENFVTPNAQYRFLSGVPNKFTIFCREQNGVQSYRSDRYGFRNPDSVWDLEEERGVIFAGDSFTHGVCQPERDTIAGGVRAEFPKTINLGWHGNGPLSDLASIREYIGLAQPKYVFWVAYTNDLGDLRSELQNPILLNYFDQRYRQNLSDISTTFSRERLMLIEEHLDSIKDRVDDSPTDRVIRGLADALKLKNTRHLVKDGILRFAENRNENGGTQMESNVDLIDEFATIIGLANHDVIGAGARLIYVRLGSSRSCGNATTEDEHRRVNQVLNSKNIAMIDIHELLCAKPNPEKHDAPGHYTAGFYREISATIVDWLKKNP